MCMKRLVSRAGSETFQQHWSFCRLLCLNNTTKQPERELWWTGDSTMVSTCLRPMPSRSWVEFTSVKLWPVLGCWPGPTPGSGCCGPGCGSGGMEWPVGRWCTAGCIHLGHRRGWPGAGSAFGTDPKFPRTSLPHRSPAWFQLDPQKPHKRGARLNVFKCSVGNMINKACVKKRLGRKKNEDTDIYYASSRGMQVSPLSVNLKKDRLDAAFIVKTRVENQQWCSIVEVLVAVSESASAGSGRHFPLNSRQVKE